MITEMVFKYVTNWIFISIILFFIVYFVFYALVIKRYKISKIINVISIMFFIFLSFLGTIFLRNRSYRYYTIDRNRVSTYTFLVKAYQDYTDERLEVIYSSNVKIEKYAKRPSGKKNTGRKASKEKVYYLNIDDGKYIIPIDKDKAEISKLTATQEYIIYLQKNTKLLKDIFIVEKGLR